MLTANGVVALYLGQSTASPHPAEVFLAYSPQGGTVDGWLEMTSTSWVTRRFLNRADLAGFRSRHPSLMLEEPVWIRVDRVLGEKKTAPQRNCWKRLMSGGLLDALVVLILRWPRFKIAMFWFQKAKWSKGPWLCGAWLPNTNVTLAKPFSRREVSLFKRWAKNPFIADPTLITNYHYMKCLTLRNPNVRHHLGIPSWWKAYNGEDELSSVEAVLCNLVLNTPYLRLRGNYLFTARLTGRGEGGESMEWRRGCWVTLARDVGGGGCLVWAWQLAQQ